MAGGDEAKTKKGEKKEEPKKVEEKEEKKGEKKEEKKDANKEAKKEETKKEVDKKKKDDDKKKDEAEPKKEEKAKPKAEAKAAKEDAKKKEEVKEEKKEETKAEEKPKEEVTAPASAAETPTTMPKRQKKRKKSQLDVLLDGDISVPTSTKRERKSLASYKPEDFAHPSEDAGDTPAKEDLPVPNGRGTKLGDLESVAASIKRSKMKGPVLAAAHKLVFSTRGRAKAKNMKPHLLKFYGYLPPVDESVAKEEWDQIEEDIEAKMCEKAYKLKSAVLKDLCDFFDVDRCAPPGKTLVDKDTLVDRLLNFLGEPKETMTRTYILSKERKSGKGKKGATPKKTTPKKKKGKRKSLDGDKTPGSKKKKAKKSKKEYESESDESEDDHSEDEETEDEEEDKEEEAAEAEAMEVDEEGGGDKKDKPKEEGSGSSGATADKKPTPTKKKTSSKSKKLPSDNALRRWVRAYVRCFNLDKATTKHAIETASDKFGVDLTEKKGRIKELLTEEMS